MVYDNSSIFVGNNNFYTIFLEKNQEVIEQLEGKDIYLYDDISMFADYVDLKYPAHIYENRQAYSVMLVKGETKIGASGLIHLGEGVWNYYVVGDENIIPFLKSLVFSDQIRAKKLINPLADESFVQ